MCPNIGTKSCNATNLMVWKSLAHFEGDYIIPGNRGSILYVFFYQVCKNSLFLLKEAKTPKNIGAAYIKGCLWY